MTMLADLIYGVPLSAQMVQRITDNAERIEYFQDTHAREGDPNPGFLGKILYTFNFDEHILMRSLKDYAPTPLEKSRVDAKLQALPQKFKDHLPAVGVWIIWGNTDGNI